MSALLQDVLQQLASVLDEAKTDDAVRAVIITGLDEKALSADVDIKCSTKLRRSMYET